jgi:hypothetical protein
MHELGKRLCCGPSGYSRRGNRSPVSASEPCLPVSRHTAPHSSGACDATVDGPQPSFHHGSVCAAVASWHKHLSRLVLLGGCGRLPAGLLPCSIARIFDISLVVFAGVLLLVVRLQGDVPFSCSHTSNRCHRGCDSLVFSHAFFSVWRCERGVCSDSCSARNAVCSLLASTTVPLPIVAISLDASPVPRRVVDEEAYALLGCRSFCSRLLRSHSSILL